MLSTLFYIAIGIFIGWNIEQPTIAKTAQARVTEWWNNFRSESTED